MRIFVGPALSLFALSLAQEGSVFEDEWRTREWALEPREHAEEIARALDARAEVVSGAASSWRERTLALEALARGLESGTDAPEWVEERARAALADPHPNVRSGALRVLARGRPDVVLEEERIRSLAADPLPLVRLALAELFSFTGGAERVPHLAALAADDDERVAAEARVALCGLGREAQAEQRALFRRLSAERRGDELLACFGFLQRGAPSAELLEALRADFAGSDRWNRSWRALVEAVSRVHDPGVGSGAGEILVRGWAGPGPWRPERQALLREAALSGDAILGETLVAALEDLVRIQAGLDPQPRNARRWVGWIEDLRAARVEQDEGALAAWKDELCEAAVLAMGGEGMAQYLERASLEDEAAVGLVRVLPDRLTAWDVQLAPVLLGGDTEVALRSELVRSCARTVQENGDSGAGRILVRALADPDPTVARAAFRALCNARDPAPWEPSLHRAWRGLDEDERRDRLAWFPRELRLDSFRDDLVELGTGGGSGRRVAVELLAAHSGDREVRERVRSWLQEDFERFLGAEPPLRRELELAVQGEIRALARLGGEEVADDLEDVLERSLGISEDIGKTAALALGDTSAGRGRISRLLDPGVERRVRIEVALALASHPGPARESAVRFLGDDYVDAAWNLRSRMVAALGESESALGYDVLESIVRGKRTPSAERLGALASLVRLGQALERDELFTLLCELAEGEVDIETQRAAMRMVGSSTKEQARAFLLTLFERYDLPEPRAGFDGERAELLRSELLAAFGQRGVPPGDLAERWLDRPLRAAQEDLGRRLANRSMARTEFAWSGELALALGHARAQTLAEALEQAGPWWRLDGRLLFALASAVQSEVDADAEAVALERILRAAWIAFAGEGNAVASRAAQVRCRLLGHAWRQGRWSAAESIARRLLFERRAGRISDPVWEQNFGGFDPRAGVDPLARLRSLVWQARAWQAIEEWRVDEARACLEVAEELCGRSSLARAQQMMLRAALER